MRQFYSQGQNASKDLQIKINVAWHIKEGVIGVM